MALEDKWSPKTDGVDDVLADDINIIAQSAIESEKNIIELNKEKIDKSVIDGSNGVVIGDNKITVGDIGATITLKSNPDGDATVLVKYGDVTAVKAVDGVSKTHKLSEKADQTFVEEKLAEIGGGGGSGQEQWRLINDVTLTEDAVVEFTTDADGKALNLKKFRAWVRLPLYEGSKTLWLGMNGVLVSNTDAISVTSSSTVPSALLSGDLEYAWQFYSCINNINSFKLGTVKSFPAGTIYGDRQKINGKPCEKIKLAINSGLNSPLPVGTKIVFWGVDA
jgi:hypothetical protein